MTCSPRCNHNRDSNLKMDKQIGWSLTMNPANMAFIKTSYSRKLLCICEFAYSWSVFLRMQTPNLIWFLYICVPISNGVLATEQVLSKYLLIKWISLHSITFFLQLLSGRHFKNSDQCYEPSPQKYTQKDNIFTFYRIHGSQLSCADGNHFQGWECYYSHCLHN